MNTRDAAPSELAYRPLAARTLLMQLVVLLVAEAGIFASYRRHEAGSHWSTHFLVGLTTAALLLLIWLALKGAPARGQLMWVLGTHLVAMFPDLLFVAGRQPRDGRPSASPRLVRLPLRGIRPALLPGSSS